jgi:hypothetical protein
MRQMVQVSISPRTLWSKAAFRILGSILGVHLTINVSVHNILIISMIGMTIHSILLSILISVILSILINFTCIIVKGELNGL